MKTCRLSLLLTCGLLISPLARANTSDPAPDSLNATLAAQRPAFSGGINEVVKLSRSGVDETVVLAYIKNSSGPFQPGADEIVQLHSLGISSPVITAMLQRGGELRQQQPAPSQPAPVAYAGYAQPAAAVTPAP